MWNIDYDYVKIKTVLILEIFFLSLNKKKEKDSDNICSTLWWMWETTEKGVAVWRQVLQRSWNPLRKKQLLWSGLSKEGLGDTYMTPRLSNSWHKEEKRFYLRRLREKHWSLESVSFHLEQKCEVYFQWKGRALSARPQAGAAGCVLHSSRSKWRAP